jgi:hypothetical protein
MGSPSRGPRPTAASAGRCRSRPGPGPPTPSRRRLWLVLRESGSGSERRGGIAVAQLVRRGAQQAPLPHDSTTGATVSARNAALSLPPKPERAATTLRTTAFMFSALDS